MCIKLDRAKQELRLRTVAYLLVLLTINTMHIYLNL